MSVASLLRSLLDKFGFYYGWIVVFLCFLLSTLTFATIYSYTVLLESLLVQFDDSLANTSLVFAVQSFVTYGGAAVLGFTIDRYGIRRLLVIGGILLATGTTVAASAGSLAVVIVGYSVIASAGMGVAFVVAYTTPPQWFGRRRGLATGIAVSGAGVGTLSGPRVANTLVQSIGWRGTYLVIGGIFVFVIGLATLLLADRPQDIDIDLSDEFGDVASPEGSSPTRSIRRQLSETATIVRRPLFGAIFLALLLSFVPLYAVLVYLVEYAESVGVSRQYGVLAISAVGAANIVAKVTSGGVSDALGKVETLMGCIMIMCVSTVLLVMFPTPRTIVAFAGLFGLGAGAIAALMSPLLASLFGTRDLSTLFGVASANFAITGVTVPYIVGLSFDVFGSYRLPFLGAAVVGSVAIVILLVIRSTVRAESLASAPT